MSNLMEHYLWSGEPELSEDDKKIELVQYLLWLKEYHPRYFNHITKGGMK